MFFRLSAVARWNQSIFFFAFLFFFLLSLDDRQRFDNENDQSSFKGARRTMIMSVHDRKSCSVSLQCKSLIFMYAKKMSCISLASMYKMQCMSLT